MARLQAVVLVIVTSSVLSQYDDYSRYTQSEPDYDRYTQPEYERFDHREPDYELYSQPQPDYDIRSRSQSNYDPYEQQERDYDPYSQQRPSNEGYPRPGPHYDQYPQPLPDYGPYPQPDYEHYPQSQPDYEHYNQSPLNYDQQSETDDDLQSFFPVRPACALECDCPINFPSAMYCDGRSLHFIPLVPAGIKYLYLQNNMINEIQANVFNNATDLVWIILDHNLIKNGDIEKDSFRMLPRLQKLFLSHNNLTKPPSALPKSLNELRLIRNKISNFPSDTLAGLDNLTALYLQGNELTSDDLVGAFEGLRSLTYLDVSTNRLTELPTGLPSKMKVLFADQNNINSIPAGYLEHLPALQFLRLSQNHIIDSGIPSGVFNISSLVELDLSYNKLQSIPNVHENLENLYLQVNEINRFDIASFCKIPGAFSFSRLKYLRLDGNIITRAGLPVRLNNCLRRVTMLVID